MSSGPPYKSEGARHVRLQPLPEAQGIRHYSGMATRQRLVVRDAATWAHVWEQMVGTQQPGPVPPAPRIDFPNKVVIVAAMGTQSTGGYSIQVKDVSLLADDASISIIEESPGSGCVTAAVLTTPVAVVVVPGFAGHASFLEHTSQRACH